MMMIEGRMRVKAGYERRETAECPEIMEGHPKRESHKEDRKRAKPSRAGGGKQRAKDDHIPGQLSAKAVQTENLLQS